MYLSFYTPLILHPADLKVKERIFDLYGKV